MSQQTTIRKLAELVNTPVEKLLEQLAEAGMTFSDPDQVVTSTEKVKLLGFLAAPTARPTRPPRLARRPKKITLSRSRKQELTVGGGKSRATVDVVVRKKVHAGAPGRRRGRPGPAGGDDERAEILRKLEESRASATSPSSRRWPRPTAAAPRKPSATSAKPRRPCAARPRKPRAPWPSRRWRSAVTDDPIRKPAPRTAMATEPASAAHRRRARRRQAQDPRLARDGRGVEEDDRSRRFRRPDAPQRVRARAPHQQHPRQGQAAPAGRPDPHRQRLHARPTAPIVREVAIGDTITVADLAQKMALKGGDVVKALFKMGVMATINQAIDHDTAALVTEELGHNVGQGR